MSANNCTSSKAKPSKASRRCLKQIAVKVTMNRFQIFSSHGLGSAGLTFSIRWPPLPSSSATRLVTIASLSKLVRGHGCCLPRP